MNAKTGCRICVLSKRRARPKAYGLADCTLITDVSHRSLNGYEIGESAPPWAIGLAAPLPSADAATIFDGVGRIGNGLRHVSCLWSTAGYHLTVDGIGSYWIDCDGANVVQRETVGVHDLETLAAVTLGAPLMIALALQGRFCLHASVVEANGRLFAFLGESGMGKSTLARYLDTTRGTVAWRRITDDTLPVAPVTDDVVWALPHLPQLKLPASSQPNGLVARQMPLERIYILDSIAQNNGVETRMVSRGEATLELVRHTVGGRLFDDSLLRSHLEFCGDVAERVPIWRLSYPRRYEALPQVRLHLERGLDLR